MSIFYSVPVIQMVFRFSYEEKSSGNQDICFYNDLCRRSLGSLSDFNHLFREGFIQILSAFQMQVNFFSYGTENKINLSSSNVGYCAFGLLFMMIVYVRKGPFNLPLLRKGSLPIEKVPNFREFSLLWSNPPPPWNQGKSNDQLKIFFAFLDELAHSKSSFKKVGKMTFF